MSRTVFHVQKMATVTLPELTAYDSTGKAVTVQVLKSTIVSGGRKCETDENGTYVLVPG